MVLWLTLHDECRAWKGHDWDVLNRLFEQGVIYDPVNKAKSIVLTDEGLAQAEELFRTAFGFALPDHPFWKIRADFQVRPRRHLWSHLLHGDYCADLT